MEQLNTAEYVHHIKWLESFGETFLSADALPTFLEILIALNAIVIDAQEENARELSQNS